MRTRPASLAALALVSVTALSSTSRAQPARPATVPLFAPALGWSNATADELERRGRRKKLVGALLMGIGAGVLLTGTAVFAYGYQSYDCRQFANTRACTDSPLMMASVFGMATGLGTFIAGIPVHVIGRHQVRQARAMRGFALAPAITPTGGTVVASVSF